MLQYRLKPVSWLPWPACGSSSLPSQICHQLPSLPHLPVLHLTGAEDGTERMGDLLKVTPGEAKICFEKNTDLAVQKPEMKRTQLPSHRV